MFSPRKTIANILPFSEILEDAVDHEKRDSYDYYFRSKENQSLFDKTTLNFTADFDFSKVNFLKLHKLIYRLSTRSFNFNNEITSLNNIFLMSPNLVSEFHH